MWSQEAQYCAVPALGQAASGVSSGLGQLSGQLGDVGSQVRGAVQRLGVRGLDAGVGCGVGLGYGYGAGLFIKPSAAEQVLRLVERTAGGLTQQVQSKLQEAGIQLPSAFQPTTNNRPTGVPGQLPVTSFLPHPPAPVSLQGVSQHGGQEQQQQQPSEGHRNGAVWEAGVSREAPTPAGAQAPADAAGERGEDDGAPEAPGSRRGGRRGPAERPEPSAEEFRALLRHERRIARLRAENRELRKAVCSLNRRLPICRQRSDEESDGSGY
ncbi:hypothetical protein GPECTOR_28g846 [Gonium pectorale]|uniref:Uncharacterized protein n=1 Tax=Gonium pectorale TaxID=33097 RepID=A0A150GF39_GONPE|nr:hypothetical protein GPECTOR_28g846 [Gonium pectorale]|eukprot:KXZ48436.1 hypothetical protein GPECTOR_28g846 [Gonium pectorale]